MFLDIKNLNLIWKLLFGLITREALQLKSRIDTIYTSSQRFGEQFTKIAPITRIAERWTFLARLQQIILGGTHCDIHGHNLFSFHELQTVDLRLITIATRTVCVCMERSTTRRHNNDNIVRFSKGNEHSADIYSSLGTDALLHESRQA